MGKRKLAVSLAVIVGFTACSGNGMVSYAMEIAEEEVLDEVILEEEEEGALEDFIEGELTEEISMDEIDTEERLMSNETEIIIEKNLASDEPENIIEEMEEEAFVLEEATLEMATYLNGSEEKNLSDLYSEAADLYWQDGNLEPDSLWYETNEGETQLKVDDRWVRAVRFVGEKDILVQWDIYADDELPFSMYKVNEETSGNQTFELQKPEIAEKFAIEKNAEYMLVFHFEEISSTCGYVDIALYSEDEFPNAEVPVMTISDNKSISFSNYGETISFQFTPEQTGEYIISTDDGENSGWPVGFGMYEVIQLGNKKYLNSIEREDESEGFWLKGGTEYILTLRTGYNWKPGMVNTVRIRPRMKVNASDVILHVPETVICTYDIVSEYTFYGSYTMNGETVNIYHQYDDDCDRYGNIITELFFYNEKGEALQDVWNGLPAGVYTIGFQLNNGSGEIVKTDYKVRAVMPESSSFTDIAEGQQMHLEAGNVYDFKLIPSDDGIYQIQDIYWEDGADGSLGVDLYEWSPESLIVVERLEEDSDLVELKKECIYIMHLCPLHDMDFSIEKYHSHNYVVVYEKPAGCTEEGYRYYKCTYENCGKEYEEPIPATGHQMRTITDKAPSCGAAGSQHQECSVCHMKETAVSIPATGNHKFSAYVVTQQPTVFAQGTKTRTCSVCGRTERIQIAKLSGTIKLTAKKLPLQVKKSTNLKKLVTGMASGDAIASWTVSNKKVATIDKNGKITGKKEGTADVTVTLRSGVKDTIRVTVQKKAVKTSKIEVSAKNVTLMKGKKLTLSPMVTPITTTDKLKYSTSNKKVATVSSKGIITAKASGKAKITIKSGSKKMVVTVTVPKTAPTKITGIPTSKTLKKGKTLTLKPKLAPKGAEAKITYKSSNKSVATVNAKGKITAKKKGTAEITITAGKITVKCKITVK